MMDWQALIVIGIVAAAAAFLARKWWRTAQGREKAGCDKCGDE
jgi:hypothetical protein